MSQFQVAINRNGGFTSLAEAKAHRFIIGKLSSHTAGTIQINPLIVIF